jgi:CRP-like cAMP-binding protein
MTAQINRINTLIGRFDEATKAALEAISINKTFKKGSYLLRQGETCEKSFYITSGIARKFYIAGVKEITTDFYFENDIAVCFASYVFQQPGNEFIECLTDVSASITDYNAFQQAKKQFPVLLELDFLMTELFALWLEERLFEFHTLSATQRYRKLMEKAPHIIQHIQLTHIASYLGISLETLSRIRAKK